MPLSGCKQKFVVTMMMKNESMGNNCDEQCAYKYAVCTRYALIRNSSLYASPSFWSLPNRRLKSARKHSSVAITHFIGNQTDGFALFK
jgi:hypothetical protein